LWKGHGTGPECPPPSSWTEVTPTINAEMKAFTMENNCGEGNVSGTTGKTDLIELAGLESVWYKGGLKALQSEDRAYIGDT
jgi:hypothetical protein